MIYTYFFFNDTATTEIYPLSLHDALPISSLYLILDGDDGGLGHFRDRETGGLDLFGAEPVAGDIDHVVNTAQDAVIARSEEHTSELQSQSNLVCRLLLEKKNRHIQPSSLV